MQDSKSNSVNGNPFTHGDQHTVVKIFFFFFLVRKVVRYNTVLARFTDNPGLSNFFYSA